MATGRAYQPSLVESARLQIRRARGDADHEAAIAAAYELIRRRYAAGGAYDGAALHGMADDLGLHPGLVRQLSRAAAQDQAIGSAPTGEELLAQVRAGVTTDIEALAMRPGPLEYEPGQKWSGD
jgi:hypothetical protein